MNNTLYQFRIYTLRSSEGLAAYLDIWDKHISSLARHRIQVHQLWTRAETLQLGALVSFANNDDPIEREQAYMTSADFRSDMTGFDMSQIVKVESTLLTVPA